MARFFFDPSSYTVGTTLADLGWVNVGAISPITAVARPGGGNWWSGDDAYVNFNRAFYIFEGTPASTDLELLIYQNFATADYAGFNDRLGGGVGISATPEVAVVTDYETTSFIVDNLNGTSFTSVTETGEATNTSLATAVRVKVAANGDYKLRKWQAAVDGLEAAEPSTWNYEGTITNYTASTYAALSTQFFADIRIDGIGVGTDGHVAPFAPLPPPVIATPTGLTTTNITATSALLDWN